MFRKLTLAAPLLAALGAAVVLAPASAGAAETACKPGKTTVNGKAAVRFCGPAKASATVGAKRFTFSGGVCSTSGLYFTINIGTIVTNTVAGAKPGPTSYFGATVTPPDSGVHLKQALSWTSGGKAYSALGNRVTLQTGLRRGSFSGTSLTGQKIRGTFTC